MYPATGSPLNQIAGGIKIWTAILMLGLCCVVAVVVFQVQEYLFYEQAPSVWHKPGASVGAVPEIAPMLPPGLTTNEPASVETESASEENVETAVEPDSGSEVQDAPKEEYPAVKDEPANAENDGGSK